APVFLEALAGEVATGTIQPRTAAFYADTLRLHVLPALGGARLRDIGAEQLERLYARHADHPRTAVAVHQTCQRLLKMAKRYRYTVTLATQEAAKPRYKAPERQPPGRADP